MKADGPSAPPEREHILMTNAAAPTDDDGNAKTREFAPSRVPDSVHAEFDATAGKVGGPYAPSPEAAGAVGHTHFDGPSAEDGTVTVLLEKKNMDQLPSQAMVRIKSLDDGGKLQRSYLGAVVKGPFAEPDGIPVNSPLLEQNTVLGNRLLARYHGRAHVHIVGEEADGQLVPPRLRPRPNSPVHVLGDDETSTALKLGGDLRVGIVMGHERLVVNVPTTEKGVLPRHLAVVGSTGGGKSQTMGNMVHGLQCSGVATIIVDVEGEYTEIDQPATHEKIVKALELRGKSPAGTKNVTVYHLVGRETSREVDAKNVKEFSLKFDELSPYTVADLLEYNDAQRDRFFTAYDTTEKILRDLKVYPADDKEKNEALKLDPFDAGYPRMTLSHLLDIAGAILEMVILKSDELPQLYNADFKGDTARGIIKTHIKATRADHKLSWLAMMKALWRIKKLDVFDRAGGGVSVLDCKELIKPGSVAVVDLSDTDSTVMNNIVIASLLRGVQKAQDEAVDEERKKSGKPTPVMLIIEEAHEFLSAERIKEMPSLFQQVARIAKRGRKRWLGLTFVTQLPQHLPDEVLGLVNNWVIHKITDANVIARLKRSISGLDEGQWRSVPGLAQGQAVVSFTSMTRPLMVAIDPSPSHVRMTD
jgi:uncharacterized protein